MLKKKENKAMRRALAVLIGVCLLFVVAAPVAMAAGPFEVTGFDGAVTKNPAGDPDTQAGSHPYEVSTEINFSTEEIETAGTHEMLVVPSQNVKNIDVELPAGLIGDPSATPRCTAEELAAEITSSRTCPANTQVGTTTVFTNGTKSTFPVWNMVPPPGVPAEFGFVVLVDPVTATATVRSAEAGGSEGYGLDIHLRNVSQGVALSGTALSFWGNPSDPRHDEERGACLLAKRARHAAGRRLPLHRAAEAVHDAADLLHRRSVGHPPHRDLLER